MRKHLPEHVLRRIEDRDEIGIIVVGAGRPHSDCGRVRLDFSLEDYLPPLTFEAQDMRHYTDLDTLLAAEGLDRNIGSEPIIAWLVPRYRTSAYERRIAHLGCWYVEFGRRRVPL